MSVGVGLAVAGTVMTLMATRRAAQARISEGKAAAAASELNAEEIERRAAEESEDAIRNAEFIEERALQELESSEIGADFLESRALREVEDAAIAEEQQREVDRQTISTFRAGVGARGVTLKGSPLVVMAESIRQAELNALNIRRRGALRAGDLIDRAGIVRLEGKRASMNLLTQARLTRISGRRVGRSLLSEARITRFGGSQALLAGERGAEAEILSGLSLLATQGASLAGTRTKAPPSSSTPSLPKVRPTPSGVPADGPSQFF